MRRNAGRDAAPSNLFTDGNPNTSTPASVMAADWANIIQEENCGLIEAAGLSIDQTNAFDDNDKTQLLQAVRILSAGGILRPVNGQAPSERLENSGLVYLFTAGGTQKLQGIFKVPASYTPGTQIRLNIGFYSGNTSGTLLFRSTSTLVRKDTDAMTSTTNQRVSTQAAQTLATPADAAREAVLDLTDGSGQINGVAVAAGDIIKVELTRGTDTSTNIARLIATATEIRFA